MNYNPNTSINDSITLTVKPLDQLKASFMQDVSVTCSVMGVADDYVLGSVTKNQDKTYTLSPNDNEDSFTITFNPTTVLPLKDTQPDVIAQKWNQNRVDGSQNKIPLFRGFFSTDQGIFHLPLSHISKKSSGWMAGISEPEKSVRFLVII